MLSRSAKSLVTLKSLSLEDVSAEEQFKEDSKIPTTVFEDLLPYLMKKFNSPFDTSVKKNYIGSDTDPLETKRSANASAKARGESITRNPAKKDENTEQLRSSKVITITAWYARNRREDLVEILIYNQRVPRILLQIIGLIAPLYDALTKITIKRCSIDGITIYELKRNLDVMNLTEICLDGSFVLEANFAILLKEQSSLRHLSLCRCSINDDVCETIVSKMHYQSVGEKLLTALHLSGNLITDKGAEFISRMLRSNRYLRYLNLAGNKLSDEGASLILDVLRDFRLTVNENADRRIRIMNYIKRKNKLVSKFMTECVMESVHKLKDERYLQATEKTKEKKGKDVRVHVALDNFKPNLLDKERLRQADASASVLIGQYHDPFGVGKVFLRDEWAHCRGNFSLCYLNLAYNNLTYYSVKKVLDLLLYQQNIDRSKSKEPGIIKIVLEGNLMPITCPEYTQINEVINKNLLDDPTLNIVKKRQSVKSMTKKTSS